MKFDVELFETAGGSPAYEFLKSLDIKSKTKVSDRLVLLAEFGNALGMPYSKYLTDGIFELRITTIAREVRMLYFFSDKRSIIVTNGFLKKTRKTPKAEIRIAMIRRKEYEQRRRIPQK